MRVRKMGEGPWLELEPAEGCVFCELAAGSLKAEGDVIFFETDAGAVQRVECIGLASDRSPGFFCFTSSREEAEREIAAAAVRLPPALEAICAKVVKERVHELARVLERMVELLGSGPPRQFGQALAQASAELGITVRRGSEDESALLTAAFQIIGSGRIPGAPDA